MERQELVSLLSPAGQKLLSSISYDSKTDVVKLVSQLRAEGYDPSMVAAVLTQAKLRKRGESKFGEFASQLLFTEAGLLRESGDAAGAEKAFAAACALAPGEPRCSQGGWLSF